MAETLLVNVKINRAAADKTLNDLLKPRTLAVTIKPTGVAALNQALRTPRTIKVNLAIGKQGLKSLENADKHIGAISKSMSKGSSGATRSVSKSVKTYTDSANQIQKAMTRLHNEMKSQQDHLRKYGDSMAANQKLAMQKNIANLDKMYQDAEKIYKKHSRYGKRNVGDTGRGELGNVLRNADRALTDAKEKRAGSARTASATQADRIKWQKDFRDRQKQRAAEQKAQENAAKARQQQLVKEGKATYDEKKRQAQQQQKLVENARKDEVKQQQLREKQLSQMQKRASSKMDSVNGLNNTFADRQSSLTSQQVADWNKQYQQAQAARAAMAKLDQKYQGGKVTGSYVGQYADEYKKLSAAQKAMQGMQTAHKNYIKAINGPQNEAVYFDKMGAKMSDYFTKFGHNLQKNQALYEKYLNLQHKANTGGFASMRDANNQWAQFRTEARKAGIEIDTFGSKLQRTFGSRIRSATAGMGVFAIQSALRGIVTSAKEVDTAMTELKKVTFESGDVYDKFLANAGGRAQDIGATLRDTVSATADFARLGYNIDEATKLADSALIYKNVGDDVDTIDDATKAIISTMQG